MDSSSKKFRFYCFICLLCVVPFIYGSVSYVAAQDNPEPVYFSAPGGFYQEEFELELSHPHPDAQIYFTLDGSIPDPQNLDGTTYFHMDRYRSTQQQLLERSYVTHSYQQYFPISIYDRTAEENYFSRMQTTFEQEAEPYYFPRQSIFKGTVVRAIAVVNQQVSSVETHTYIVAPEGRSRFSLPVISLVVQEDQLFGYEKGIYVPGKIYDDQNPFNTDGNASANQTQRGIEWERVTSFELFESESKKADLRHAIGVRIHGGWSRAHPMKSLRLYSRSIYGEGRFRHQFFPDEPYTVFNRLILRNAGNDWPEAMLRDPLMQGIVKHMNIDTQAYRPHVVFINGEYWGIHSMRERYDKHYLERKYGVDPENIDLLTGNAWVKEGSNRHYRETMDYIREHGLEDDHHYEYINTRIDIENYIDYQIAKIFVANTDWPGNNIDFWRNRTEQFEPDAPPGQDGRWRWLVFDMDFGFHLHSGCNPGNDACTPPDHNTLEFAARDDGSGWPNPPWSTELFRELLKNEQFRNNFITRYLDQLNSAFLPDRLKQEILRVSGTLEPEMEEHLERWFSGRNWHHFARWNDLIHNRILPFAEQRQGYAIGHLKQFFNLGSRYRLTVDVSDPAAGFVQVNTVNITTETPGVGTNPWPWSGIYFEDVPVLLRAHPMPGYRFSHWEGDRRRYHHPELKMDLAGAESIKAVFYPDESVIMFPTAHSLREGAYILSGWHADVVDKWPADQPEDGYPENMAFVYMDQEDPGLSATIAGFTEGVYNHDSRTRINGLGDYGFAFINTTNGNVGFPNTRLGGAILAINTRRIRDIYVQWDGITVLPNSRVYNLRLQYRVGSEGPFKDLLDENGKPVEYRRHEEAGHRIQTGPVKLPVEAEDKAYVQLLWRYYYTGVRLYPDSGQRSKMAVTNIRVEGLEIGDEDLEHIYPQAVDMFQNYPNPFNNTTLISYELPEAADVRLDVYDMLGRRIETLVYEYRQAGAHHVRWDASAQASGVYICRLQVGDQQKFITISLLK